MASKPERLGDILPRVLDGMEKRVPKDSLVYLASPYSHPDPSAREARFQTACMAAAHLMRHGALVFSPIAHTHPIAQYDLPKDWQFWKRYDMVMLAACDELYVLTLMGWENSVGVKAEINIMREADKPVRFFDVCGTVCFEHTKGWVKSYGK